MNLYGKFFVSCAVAILVLLNLGASPGLSDAQEAERWESPPAATEPVEESEQWKPDSSKAELVPGRESREPIGEEAAPGKDEPEPASAWKRKLTIPDIVIYGKDRTHIRMEQKEYSLQEDPAFPPEMVYRQKTSVPEEILLEQKQIPETASVQPRPGAVTGRARAGYGSFNSLLFSVYHLHGLEILEYEFHGDFRSSSGHVDHSEFSIWDIGVGIMPLLGRQKARIELGISRADYAMWGADHPSREREFDENHLSVNMTGDIRHSLLYDLTLSGANLAVDRDPESDSFDVETVGAALGLMTDWRRLTLFVKGGTLREDFRRYWEDYLVRWTWEAGADWRMGKQYVLSFGAGGIHAGLAGGGTFEKFYPNLRLACIPRRGLTLALSYRPSIEFDGFAESLESNRFLDLTSDGSLFYPLPLWRSFDAGFYGEYVTSHNLNVRFDLRFTRYRDFPFWIDADGDGLFDLGAMDEVEEIRCSLSSRIPLSSRWSLLPELTGYRQVSLNDSQYPDAERIPYRPALEADILIRYEREEADLRSDLSLRALGSRFIHPEEDVDLDSACLIDLYAEKGLVPGITIWGLAENLLGSDYGLWEGYPMPGISFSLGLKGKW